MTTISATSRRSLLLGYTIFLQFTLFYMVWPNIHQVIYKSSLRQQDQQINQLQSSIKNESNQTVHMTTSPTQTARGTTPESLGTTHKSTPNILCIVMTVHMNYQTRTRAVNRTWGRRCNQTYYVGDIITDEFNMFHTTVTNTDKAFVTERLFEALSSLWRRYRSFYDWYYIADDDTYVIVENLRHFLSLIDPSEKHYTGFVYTTFDNADTLRTLLFAHGGSGFALSSATMDTLVNKGINKGGKCIPFKQPGDTADVNIGWCLKKLNIFPTRTVDQSGRELFVKENPIELLRGQSTGELIFYGYRDVITSPPRKHEALSEHAIAFHYVTPGDMYLLDFLLYNLARGSIPPRDRLMLNIRSRVRGTAT